MFVLLTVLVFILGSSATEIEDQFVRHKVIKDVIGLAPSKLLKVAFDSEKEVWISF